jgi:NAD(P)-dependent dehydrogenase (short-subunit alcohol dehydrogenase family)
MTVSLRLDGKVAIVTGGSRGIGRAIAAGFADSGAIVVVASRKLAACQKAASEISATYGVETLAHACHVGDWANCDDLIDAVLDRFGRLDILVNNAGMSPPYDTLINVTEELYDKTLAVNLKGPFRLGVRAGAYMAAQDGGSIINIGTIGSLLASPRELPYACAKAALNSLTVGLAEAYAPTVRCNAILPGAFDTDITRTWTADMKSGSYVPLRRLGQPEEIVGAAVYLASDAASYTTGSTLRVDGGVTRKIGS